MPAPPRVAFVFAFWVGVLTALTGPLALINPLFIGWVQDRYDVADKLQRSQDEIDRINGEMVWGIMTGGEFDVAFLNGTAVLDTSERSHMGDVSRLVRILVVLELVAIAFAAWGGRLLQPETVRLGRMLMYGAGSVGVATLAIGAFAVLAWESAFTIFHELLFPPGTWTFPADSTLIRLYPPEFWFDAAMVAGTLILASAATLSYVGLRRIREVDVSRPTC